MIESVSVPTDVWYSTTLQYCILHAITNPKTAINAAQPAASLLMSLGLANCDGEASSEFPPPPPPWGPNPLLPVSNWDT